MNTPSPHQPEEWRERFDTEFGRTWTAETFPHPLGIQNYISQLLHTERQAAIAQRDAYWKERVRKEVEGLKGLQNLYNKDQALDTLLDNLK